jgi:hypothetical protein
MMLSRGAKVCDWIECTLKVPEGSNYGEYLVLPPWQVKTLYLTYTELPGPDAPIAVANGMSENELLASSLQPEDVEAMKSAMYECVAESPERRRQLEKMRKLRPMHRVGAFASYVCQRRALGMTLDETPPCHINDLQHPDPDEVEAARTLERMLAAGLSKWDPDPTVLDQEDDAA